MSAWRASFGVELLGGEPHEDVARRIADELVERSPADAELGLPSILLHAGDGYVEAEARVDADSRAEAVRVAGALCADTLAAAGVECGELAIGIAAPDDDADDEPGEDDLDDAGEAIEIVPDTAYAAAFGVADPVAAGALKLAALVLLAELDEALHAVAHGLPAAETPFAQDLLPSDADPDEDFLDRLRVCAAVVGAKLAQDPPVAPAAGDEQAALAVQVALARQLLHEGGHEEARASLDPLDDLPAGTGVPHPICEE